jgi:AcrR family transcriptional regulator
MSTTGDPDVDAILDVYATELNDAPDPNESLRARKKRRARQQISNVATAMFLAHGFDNVTVARIAAACEVSEQTVFNYFPTKESMFFDRSESVAMAVADAVRERGEASLVEDVVRSLSGGVHFPRAEVMDDAVHWADLARFIDEVSSALAERIGVDSMDPEVQLAAFLVAGLLRVGLESTFHHAQQATSISALNRVVRRDILKAAQLAEPTLTAFDNI